MPYLQDRKAIQISQDVFDEHLIQSLNQDKRIVNVSSSRKDLVDLNFKIAKQTDKKAKFYDKFTDKEDLKNVNEIWKDYSYIGYTPVIQTGISYMNEPFDLCYANLKSSNLARDAMQMLLRCRELNDEIVYYSINKKQTYNTTNINMFDNYEDFNNDRVNKLSILLKDLNKDHDKNEVIIDGLINVLTIDNPILLKVMYYNLQEMMISTCHYNSMCVYLLKMQNYNVIELEDTKDREKTCIDRDYTTEYETIDLISSVEIDTVKYGVHKDDVLQTDNYYFEGMTVKDLNIDDKPNCFINTIK
jgi:hypothetical protein